MLQPCTKPVWSASTSSGIDGLRQLTSTLAKELHRAVLKRDWPETIKCPDPLLFGKENKKSSIQAIHIQNASMKFRKKLLHLGAQGRPEFSIGGTKAIRARARTGVHCKESLSDFGSRKWLKEGRRGDVHMQTHIREVEAPFSFHARPSISK